jgi:glutathione S-transferase
MSEFQLYCFAQSGNAYRAALMLNLIDADWQPMWIDFFGKGVQRTAEYRTDVNEMGEVPVLVHGQKKLTQSGVILTYLSNLTGRTRGAPLDHFRQSEGQRLPRSISLLKELRQAAR